MNILRRMRALVGLGEATGAIGDATKRRLIRVDDAARLERHGDVAETARNVRAFSSDLEEKAREIG